MEGNRVSQVAVWKKNIPGGEEPVQAEAQVAGGRGAKGRAGGRGAGARMHRGLGSLSGFDSYSEKGGGGGVLSRGVI